MPNPVKMLEMVGNLSKAATIYAKLEKMDTVGADGSPGADKNPDLQQLFDACKKFVSDLDALNKDAVRIVKLESVLVAEVKSELNAQSK